MTIFQLLAAASLAATLTATQVAAQSANVIHF